VALLASGCAEKMQVPSWLPWGHHSQDLSGIPSPTERVENLRKLAKDAAKTPPAQKLQVSQELSQEIQRQDDPLIRAEIVRTLAEYPGPATDQVLRAAVKDPDADVRLAACDTWAKRGDSEAAKQMAGLLAGDIDRDVRFAAARALAHTHDQAAITALAAVLEDGDPAMQYQAVLSLREITHLDLGNDVNRWREYNKSGKLQPGDPPSLAERMRRTF
jgi:HEAT repeat protein